MAINISAYTDPGVYIAEVIAPGAVSVSSERVMCLVGIAPRTRREIDEPAKRGKVYAEALTVSASTPFVAQLVNTSDRNRNEAVLYMNGNELGLGDWWFLPAYLVGLEWAGATIDVSSGTGTAQYFTISLDGKRVVTIDMDAAVTSIGGAPAAATATDICDAINYELGNSAGTYYTDYGADYAAVATHATGIANEIITITSPSSESISDIKVFVSADPTNDGASEISNTAWLPTSSAGVQAPTWVQIKDESYVATATYTLDYIAIDLLTDVLANADATTPLDRIVNVGTFPGGTSFTKDTDYQETGNTIEWDSTPWANSTISGIAGPYSIVAATNDKLYISLNDLTPILITLTTGLPTPTAANVAADINAALNASTVYGPAYAFVASDAAGTLQLDVPDPFENFPQEKGVSSTIEFLDTSDNAFDALFGTGITLPYEVFGVGLRPAFGSEYFITYDYTRPSTDYETAHRVFDPDQLYEYTSPLTLDNYIRNKLCIAGEIAFENEANSIWVVQINDSTTPGTPTQNQINSAIDVCGEKKGITEVVVLDTGRTTAVYTMQHVSEQSSMLEKHYRRGWYGMARDTDPGDPDTPDTFIYRSTQVLQPGGTSPGRGRHILCAPGSIERTITLDTQQEITLDLDGSYLAASVCAAFTALPSPSSALIGKFVKGFNEEGFETYLRGERHSMADKGVTVVTLDAGRFVLLDPLTTEAGAGKVVQFEEPSASAQKDAVTDTIDVLITNNLVGVVPDDLADFISDIKKWIMLGLLAQINAGTIAPYRDEAGFPRDIDASSDIQVYQSSTDPRTFYFKYWFNLKYPAKRFFGEYSVDNPFFAPA